MSAQLSSTSFRTAGLLCFATLLGLFPPFLDAATAQSVAPIKEPITGNEDLGDLSQPRQALAQFYRAFKHTRSADAG